MTRSIRIFAASIAALCSLTAVSTVAFAQKPSPSPAVKPKMSGKKPATKTNKPAAKKMPMRDPKTGKFIKASPSPAPKMSGKKTPMRDPKTGRFMKASPSPAPKKP